MSQSVVSARIKGGKKDFIWVSFTVQQLYKALNGEAMFVHFNTFCDSATIA